MLISSEAKGCHSLLSSRWGEGQGLHSGLDPGEGSSSGAHAASQQEASQSPCRPAAPPAGMQILAGPGGQVLSVQAVQGGAGPSGLVLAGEGGSLGQPCPVGSPEVP